MTTPFLSRGTITASYGFGSVEGGETTGHSGTTKPTGVSSASDLSGDSLDPTRYPGQEWKSNLWFFGDALYPPLLKYADYDGTGGIDYCGKPLIKGAICGVTLLPGQ